MLNYRYILLDLDGTITDPAEGITKSVEYALNHFGIGVEDRKALYPFIGPPLYDSFREFYNFTDGQAKEAIVKYRERFAETGIYENKLYEGINDFLEAANLQGKSLMLATSKPTIFAKRILDYFNLSKYFSFVAGSGLDGSFYTKGDVIRHVLETNKLNNPSAIVMVGDRKHDIIGAKENNIDSIGVLYGYGDRKELEKAGANYIVNDIAGLRNKLLS
ncbi:MAG: 5'-nucleotidase [Parabacteroides sp.]